MQLPNLAMTKSSLERLSDLLYNVRIENHSYQTLREHPACPSTLEPSRRHPRGCSAFSRRSSSLESLLKTTIGIAAKFQTPNTRVYNLTYTPSIKQPREA